ncbi:MAG: BamA/TamA family outer membrane protein [Elusimicrobia bacterium]|nr:BamA/TamA family outer membrane protein [Elusimicrobiota bacterium]
MPRRACLASVLLLASALPVLAEGPLLLAEGSRITPITPYAVDPPTSIPRGMQQPKEGQPWPIRLMIAPLRRGMFIRLPIIDTDPNRGVTYGVMPIWVLQEAGGDRIEHIWAPSLTYNETFKATPTFRYYHYPTPDADLMLRASISQVKDREVMGEYHDRNFQGFDYEVGLKAQYDVNGSRRFFGVGPDAPASAESNYVSDVIQLQTLFGLPLVRDYGWIGKVSHHIAGVSISDGPVSRIPDISRIFPGAAPVHRHQSSNFRLSLDYDTRDHDVTTGNGSFVGVFGETSQRGIGSEYVFQRYGLDLRHFHPWSRAAKQVTVGNLKFQQVSGDPPFWLLPQLGGKYVHRGYGEGRFVDRGMVTAQLEHRYTFYSVKVAGVTTEFEAAPFCGVGTVFHAPASASARYARPVVGGAVRAVARPQVVGSVDFGVGQEGVTAFMDINYSF